MLFKVAFDKEIHILKSSNANSLADLKLSIPKVFKQFPQKFYLSYLDEDADEITLASENDFKILLSTAVKSVKIMIRQKSEDFYDETQRIQIQERMPNQIQVLMEKDVQMNQNSMIQSTAPHDKSMDESIQEKLKLILPNIVSQIKKEVTEELMNQSRLSEASRIQPKKDQPKKIELPKVIHKGYTCDGCQKHDIEGVRYKCAVCNNFDFCEKCEATVEHPHPFLKIKNPSQSPIKIVAILRDQNNSFECNGQRFNMDGLNNLINHGLNFAQQFVAQNKPATCSSNVSAKEPQKQEAPKCQQKVEKKIQPKVQAKIEPKVEPKVETKVETKVPKVEEKVQNKSEVKQVQKAVEKEQKAENNSRQQKIIQNANYLCLILEINFTKCYKFAQKYQGRTKEQLLQLYINTRQY